MCWLQSYVKQMQQKSCFIVLGIVTSLIYSWTYTENGALIIGEIFLKDAAAPLTLNHPKNTSKRKPISCSHRHTTYEARPIVASHIFSAKDTAQRHESSQSHREISQDTSAKWHRGLPSCGPSSSLRKYP